MSQEFGARPGLEFQVKGNEITSLRRAKEAASQLKEESLNNLVKVILKERFGLNEPQDDYCYMTNLRQGKGLLIEKREIGKDEWKPVTSNVDLVDHLEKTLNQKSDTTLEPENYLGGYVEDVACGVQQVKQQYIEHQLTLIGDRSEESRKRLDDHTAIDLDGRVKFKKINSKGKVFNYSVKSGKKFREDATTVLETLETNKRVSVKEKKINKELVSFLTGVGVVLLNEFIIKGDHKTLQALAAAGSVLGYLFAQGGSVVERALPGTMFGSVGAKLKECGSIVFTAAAGIAGAEFATNLAHGIIYQSEHGKSVGVEAHMNTKHDVEIHNNNHVPSYNHPEQQVYGAEVPDAQDQKPTIESLSQIDPRHTTESQLHTQVGNIVGDTDWVNSENGYTKVDVLAEWIKRLWGHNKGEPLTKAQIDAMKMVNDSKSFLDFMRIRPFINKFIASNVN